MAAFKKSLKINELVAKMNGDDVCSVASSTCTNLGDDGDTSGLDVFKNGFMLAQEAAGKDVYASHTEGTSYFFIGAEEDILGRLAAEQGRDRDEEGEEEDDVYGDDE